MLFSCSACSNDQKENQSGNDNPSTAAYIGEWKANSLKSRFDNEITYQVSIITLEKNGTCNYEGQSATWEYIDDLNQIVFTLDANNVNGVLEVGEEDGKTVLKYSSGSTFADKTYYRSQDFEAKDKVYVGADGELYDTVTEIQITLDNWQAYYEISESVEWVKNDFGEAVNLSISQVIKPKEEYKNIIDINNSSVAFKFQAVKSLVGIDLDLSKEEFSYTDIKWEEYTEEYTTTATVTNNDISFFSCSDGYLGKNGVDVTNIEILENIIVSRVSGSIFLYQ